MIKFNNSYQKLIEKLIEENNLHRRTVEFHLLNTYNLGLAEKNPTYKQLLGDTAPENINLPDGWPVALWLSIINRSFVRQIRGSDLLRALVVGAKDNSHFFLGSTNETLSALEKHLQTLNPSAKLSGFVSPSFEDSTDSWLPQFTEYLKNRKVDFLWVGLGTPKQDYVARFIANSNLDVKGVFAVGAAFDFIAGTKKEVQPLIRKLGLEWLHRLLIEPKRLWKRYTIYQIYFIIAVLKRSFR
jgi:N-acetylglucosaminyldiphosphoundecaprenol N-acetyl-beta-D-mannosaminyltransferase